MIKTFVSVIITSYNDGYYLDNILKDLSCQTYPSNYFEILLLEAGDYTEDRVKQNLNEKSHLLRYWNGPGLSRATSLNNLVKNSKGELIVRLDARSHINENYLERITKLSNNTSCTNVGGIQVPIGKDNGQKKIAKLMRHPICFGNAKYRKHNYVGEAETVYLGAFRRDIMLPEPWFDENNWICEDSDLNFRIKQNGGRVYVDSNIIVEYFPRESLILFFKLCYNYGVSRSLFFTKHGQFSATRQYIPPFCTILGISLLLLGLLQPFFMILFYFLLLLYLIIIFRASFYLSNKIKDIIYFVMGFIGCHLFWTTGLFARRYFK